MDEAVADLKVHSDAGFSAVLELLSSTTAEVRSMRAEVAQIRGLNGIQSRHDGCGG